MIATETPSRGLSMAELHQLVGALYLEITWLRKELERLTAAANGDAAPLDEAGAVWDAVAAQWDPPAGPPIGPVLRTQTEAVRVTRWSEALVYRTSSRPRLERTVALPDA